MKFNRRNITSFFYRGNIFSVLIIILSFTVAGVLLFASGVDPISAYLAMGYGLFGTTFGISEIFVAATPLLIIGLGLIFAFRCGVWNIGVEGQLYMGALGATMVGIAFTDSPIPSFLQIVITIFAGFIMGAVWGFIPGVLRAKRGINEILSTLMLNYIAIWFVHYMIHWPLLDPMKWVQRTYDISTSSELPVLLSGTRLHAGIVLAIILVVVTYILFKKTTIGYRIKAVGSNPQAAKFAGISVSRTIILVMVISGGLSGVAGGVEIMGIHHDLADNFSPGYGFISIAVVLLGSMNALGVLAASFFFGGLSSGAGYLQRAMRISPSFIFIIEGIVILFLLTREFFIRRQYRSE
jgi:simple sugar transport system permease protein